MTPLEKDLKDLLNNKILKTKMYSFDEVRVILKLERRRIREELDRGKKSKITWMMYDGVVWLREKEVLALLSDEKFQVMNKEEASIDRYLELERRYGEEKGK